jgi:penicillin-binding protein 2
MSTHQTRQQIARQSAAVGSWEARWTAIRAAPRVVLLGLLILGIFGAFGLRLWDLQFVQGDYYRERAARQSTRPITVPAARGIIYDANGKPLVRNIPSFDVTIVPAYLPEDEAEREVVLKRLARLLRMPYTVTRVTEGDDEPVRGVLEIVEDAGYIYRPVMVKRGVDRDTALLVAQQALLLPGVLVEVESARYYPYGELVSQIMGYLLPIPEEGEEEYIAQGYEPATDRIGSAGIEATYEQYLRGSKGEQIVEEDVLGRVIRVVSDLAQPVPGDNVYLTLDLELQQFVEDALRAGMGKPNVNSPRGVAIVMNPQTGEILAMVSLPTFDNNIFTHGISLREWQALAEDIHRPTLNHAISDYLPPGSVFKIVMASAALQEGVVTPYTRLTCPGTIVIPNKYSPNDPGLAQSFLCWNRSGHGSMDIVAGIAQSCDIFFYQVGGGFEETGFEGLYVERIARYARMFGLGELTGVELPYEVEGLVPTADWKRHTYGESWSTGDTYNLSIGQGYLTVTPLQMLNAANVVANGGTLYRPRIVHHVTDAVGNVIQPFEPEIIRTVAISQEHWSLVRQGMEGAVAYGTARQTQIEGLRVAGKTGTAQFCDDIMCGVGYQQPEHAWFLAYASLEDVEEAQVSVIVFLYNGGEGTTAAVPVAHDILEHYFGLDQVEQADDSTS